MTFDPTACKPGTIESLESGGTAFVGESATRLFQMRAIISALRLEQKGMRLSRGISALRGAKTITGLKTNDREKQIDALEAIATTLAGQVNRS